VKLCSVFGRLSRFKKKLLTAAACTIRIDGKIIYSSNIQLLYTAVYNCYTQPLYTAVICSSYIPLVYSAVIYSSNIQLLYTAVIYSCYIQLLYTAVI